MSYDLTIKTAPGRVVSPAGLDQLMQEFCDSTGLDGPCEVVKHKAIADDLDVFGLNECLSSGQFANAEFRAFCAARSIKEAATPEAMREAAFQFLIEKCGQDLFTLGLPRQEEAVREAYRLIVSFAKPRALVVQDPQVGQDIDLDNPGDLPPMWR